MIEITITVLTILEIFIAILIILFTLMQRPKQEGLGAAFGEGVTGQMFGAQTTDILQKITVWLGSIFLIAAVALTILHAKKNHSSNKQLITVEQKKETVTPEQKKTEATPKAIKQEPKKQSTK